MKKTLQEFKDFVTTGNLVAIAIGLLIGIKVGEIVSAFNSYLFTPIFAMFGGKPSFNDAAILTINNAEFKFGAFFTVVIDFVMVAFVAFLIVKATLKIFPPKDSGPTEVELLTEIRDSLKK